MTNTLLIRREVTADRGPLFVTTDEVLDAIKDIDAEEWTTRDVTDLLMLKRRVEYKRLERAVRAAVNYLIARGQVEKSNKTIRLTAKNQDQYLVTCYALIKTYESADVALLNKIFFGFSNAEV